jgi:hypothetical protein
MTTSTSSNKRKHNTPTTTTATSKTKKKSSSASPSSSTLTKAASKNTTTVVVVVVVVTKEDIVKHGKNIHDERHTIIRTVFRREEDQLLSELRKKYDAEICVLKDQMMTKQCQMLDKVSHEFKDTETKIEKSFRNKTTTTATP